MNNKNSTEIVSDNPLPMKNKLPGQMNHITGIRLKMKDANPRRLLTNRIKDNRVNEMISGRLPVTVFEDKCVDLKDILLRRLPGNELMSIRVDNGYKHRLLLIGLTFRCSQLLFLSGNRPSWMRDATWTCPA